MRTLKILTATCLLGAAAAANAGITSTWTATNDYDFRGFTQTENDPALQGSLDYAHDSGWYIGGWASNVKFGTSDPDIELDIYTGFTKTFDSKWGYDVGLVYYTYHSNPDPGVNYAEVYAGVSYDWFKAKLFYSPKFGGDAAADAAKLLTGDDGVSAFYISADATIPLPQNFSVLAHAGYSWGDYWDVAGDKVTDYSIGVGYTAGNFNLALKWVDQNTDIDIKKNEPFSNAGRVVFTVATTFPWK